MQNSYEKSPLVTKDTAIVKVKDWARRRVQKTYVAANPLVTDKTVVTLVKKRKRQRVWEIDFLRGVCVILMVLDHLALLLSDFFGPTWYGWGFAKKGVGDAFTVFCHNWIWSDARDIIHPIVLFVFFSISGISCTFSRNNAKRGFILGAIALLYTLGSYVAQEYIGISGVFVAFGVLDFLAVSMLLYALVSFVCKDNRWGIAGVSVALIAVTLCLYFLYTPPMDTPKIFAIIFPPRDFYGNPSLFYTQSEFSPGDLFTMIPYTAFYFAGVLIGELFYYERMSLFRFTLTKYVFTKTCDALTVGTRSEKKSLRDFSSLTLTTLLGTQKVVRAVATSAQKVVCFLGRHALIIYVIHVVLLAVILSLITGLFITPGNFGF